MIEPTFCSGLADLAARYRGFIVDQWGVLHDGIDASLYDAVVTSGEATWQALAGRTEPFFAALERRCILWSRYGDRSVVEGLPLEVVERVDDADFLLLAGVED